MENQRRRIYYSESQKALSGSAGVRASRCSILCSNSIATFVSSWNSATNWRSPAATETAIEAVAHACRARRNLKRSHSGRFDPLDRTAPAGSAVYDLP